jgi:hypothetical protein
MYGMNKEAQMKRNYRSPMDVLADAPVVDAPPPYVPEPKPQPVPPVTLESATSSATSSATTTATTTSTDA